MVLPPSAVDSRSACWEHSRDSVASSKPLPRHVQIERTVAESASGSEWRVVQVWREMRVAETGNVESQARGGRRLRC